MISVNARGKRPEMADRGAQGAPETKGHLEGFGGVEGDRTPDLVIANDALSQLSYDPNAVLSGGFRARCQAGKAAKLARGNGLASARFSRPRATWPGRNP